MIQEKPIDRVIGGLAAQVNAAHGRGVGHPIRHPARFNSCRPPSSAGVCDHGMKSVGEVYEYSGLAAPSSQGRFLPILEGESLLAKIAAKRAVK